MAKNKQAGRPHAIAGTKKGERSKVVFSARIRPDVAARFAAFVERYDKALDLKVEKASHVEKAMNEYIDREEAKL